jgi:hypothetical protein
MKKTSLLIFCLIISFTCSSQTPNFDWAKQIGGAFDEDVVSMTIDKNGNVYTTGTFYGTIDCDPNAGVYNLTSVGNRDIFIIKLDILGNFVWAKRIGNSQTDYGCVISVDERNNVYLGGSFNMGTLDVDPGSGNFNLVCTSYADIFILKLDANGNFLWAKQLDGGISSGVDWINSLVIDSSQNIISTGRFFGTSDFDPGTSLYTLTSAGISDIFILKLDSLGEFVWAKQLGGDTLDIAYSITVDKQDNIYTYGMYSGLADFDPGMGVYNLLSNSDRNAFISKLDVNGNFVFAKQFGNSILTANSIAIDDYNNIYACGSYSGTADFDPNIGVSNLTSISSYDGFVLKLDENGNFIWAKSVDAFFGKDHSINVDNNNNLFCVGTFTGTVDFNLGAGVYNIVAGGGSSTSFILKLDQLGNFVWAEQLYSTLKVMESSIFIDNYNNIYSAGTFNTTADFDPSTSVFNITTLGSFDVFVHKMSQTTNGINTLQNYKSIEIQPNPTISLLYIKSKDKIQKIEITNVSGQLVIYEEVNEKFHKIQMSNLTNGIYFTKFIFSDGISVTEKIIKQ